VRLMDKACDRALQDQNFRQFKMGNELNHFRFKLAAIEGIPTPFYYYDMNLLNLTLDEIQRQISGYPFKVHYALKANCNHHILNTIARSGLSGDLVSGGEMKAALAAGFKAQDLNYAGVGKTDGEIMLGLEHGIGCFNVESVPEMQIIDLLAGEMGKTAPIAIRVNPDIDAHTHKYITTGTAENKFGINIDELEQVIDQALSLPHTRLRGLHFHIGSQILQMRPFELLCDTVNRLLDHYEQRGINFEFINVGGGLGIDYSMPDEHPIANFKQYFDTFKQHLHLRQGQELHFELGRAIVGACGSLISRVTFVKEKRNKKFVILDAGMNDLIRPALYDAYHKVQNLTSQEQTTDTYDVVGPICESSDLFAQDCELPLTRRGDLFAIRTAGAYGESMASTYNMRPLPQSIFSTEI